MASLFCILATLGYSSSQQAPLGSTVMGIDFGSQNIKISYVVPGASNPLQIALNDMADRKTVNAVAFRNGLPFLGPHALKPIINQPERGYLWLNCLLGRQFQDPEVADHLSYTIAGFSRDPERGTVLAKTVDDKVAPVEYLVAMLLSKLVEQTETDSKRLITDAVITVPPYFTQAQRQAILDAAKIAGLPILSLTNDISAAALYYGTFSSTKMTEPRYAVIMDSGATHTSAALVYVHPSHVEDGKTAVLVEVRRIVSDTRLNGLAIDRAVAKILAAKFGEENEGMDVPFGKPFNRLMAEASKVKHILSANTEIRVNIEELVGDNHLSTKISREELEAGCLSLHSLGSELINRLISEANIGMDEITQIIPIGSNNRVPFVKEDLKKNFGDKVQYALNMDEIVAQGAAWYAATLARFRVKPTRFRDSYPCAVSLSYTNMADVDATPSVVSIYPAHSFVDGHKRIVFKNMESVDCLISAEGQGNLLEAKIEGVTEALEAVKDKSIISQKLKFWVDLNSSGMVEMKDKPVVAVEHEVKETRTVIPAPISTGTLPSEQTVADTPVDPVVETVNVVKTESLPLGYSVKRLYSHLSPEVIEHWAENIRKIKEAERFLVRRSTARNNLEANVYRLKDRSSQETFISSSQEAERTLIDNMLDKAIGIIDDDEKNHTTEDYEKMLTDLLEPEKIVESRISEQKCRPAAIEKLRKQLSTVEGYVSRMYKDFPDPISRAQTDRDLEELQKKVEGLSTWLADIEARQAKQAINLDPVVLCTVIDNRAQDLLYFFAPISVKKLPPPPPPTPTPTPMATPQTIIEEAIPTEKKPDNAVDESTADKPNDGEDVKDEKMEL